MSKNKEEKVQVHVVCPEIVGLDTETNNRWRMLANTVKRVTNCYWRSWLVGHTIEGNVEPTQQYLAELQAWYKAGSKGLKPRNKVQELPPAVVEWIGKETKRYAVVNDRCVQLVLSIQRKELFKPSSKGAIPRWVRILADDGEFPSSSSPQPIPFDRKNSGIIVPTSDGGDFQLRVRVDRIARVGKKALSTQDVVCLGTRGKKGIRQREILWKIAQGREYVFCGSQLVYKESKRKWFAHIAYRIKKEVKPELDSGRVAFLRPAKKRPWWLRIAGYHHYLGGKTGKFVAHVRRQLLTDRWDREEGYQICRFSSEGSWTNASVGKDTHAEDPLEGFREVGESATGARCHSHVRRERLRPIGLFPPGRFNGREPFPLHGRQSA